MIKTGIYGADNDIAGDLIKILLHHPDVDLRWLCSSAANVGLPAAEIHRQLAGETDMEFVSVPALNAADVVFLCSSPQENRHLLTTVPDVPAGLKFVDVSGEFRNAESGDMQFVYAMPELNRKALVRGATRAAIPSVMATSVALPLLPLAKNLLLSGPVCSTVVGSPVILPVGRKYRATDNLISLVGDTKAVESEISGALRSLQMSFSSQIRIIPVAASHTRGIMSVTEIETNVGIGELTRLYHSFFDDHNFISIVAFEPTIENVRGTNKALINLNKTDNRLVITAVMDDILKGISGNAVHVMNLLFGLSEKTGLIL